jgi:acyl-CoA synthetase (AMP-forming)/AMP-acid ligase II
MNHLQTLRAYEEWASLADLREGDRYLMINPYFHTFGLKAGLVASFLRGATMVPMAVFDVDKVVELVEAERITMLPGPPTLYHSLLTVADKSKLVTLRAAVTGAADIPVELIRRIRDDLPFESLMTGYGLTEAGNVTLSRPGDSPEDVATTAGLPCEDVEVRIADDGEVLVRGYNVMQGYLDDPVATAEAIDDDGWLHTGDLGTMDERGFFTVGGRLKDMIIRGGENIYPREIEEYLHTHPCVSEAQVIGVPSARYGEEVMAWVRLVAGQAVTEEDLLAHCRGRIATYKIPRFWKFVDEFPMTVTGKIQKFRMREVAIGELGLADAETA